MHLVNSFNAGITNDFITPTDSADSGDPVTAAGPGCQYAYQAGHYCVICPDPGDELYWETGAQNAWRDYYLRFDMYIDAGQPSWGMQRYATFFIGDGIDYSPGQVWTHWLWVGDDGRLWVEDENSTRLMDLGIQFRFGQWNTITFSQDLTTGETRLAVHHQDGTGVNSGPVIYPTMTKGLNSVNLGRPGGMGSGGSTLWVDNLRGYTTHNAPAARDPRTTTGPETPGPHTSDPWTNDPDPTNTDPDDPTWNPGPAPAAPAVTGMTPTHGPAAGGTVVTITGTDLTAVNDVLFGFVPGTGIIEHGGTSLTVTTPAHPAAPATVQIDTTHGSDSSRTFTFDAATPPPYVGPWPDPDPSQDPWHPTKPVVPPPKGVEVTNPVPHVDSGPSYYDDEILYSGEAFVQKGCVLGAAQGVLAAGTVMAHDDTDHRWYAYTAAGTNGRNTARGILRRSADTAAGPQSSNILLRAVVKLHLVVGLDATAMTQLDATGDPTRDWLRF